MTLPVRYWSKVDFGDGSGCWEWTASKCRNGYGRWRFEGKTRGAHIFSYIDANGLVPSGLELDHLCRNRCCVRPSHLEAVTRYENMRRSTVWQVTGALQTNKTHCPSRHEYSYDNIYYEGKQRHCKICKKTTNDKHNAIRKAARHARGLKRPYMGNGR